QETFLRAAKSLRSIPAGRAREEAWLVRVLINIRRDEWRRAAVRRRSVAILGADPTTDDSNLESALIAKREVWGALDALHPRRRAIVIMSELEGIDRKSTRLNSSHVAISYAVFCLKKKKQVDNIESDYLIHVGPSVH